MRYRQLGKTGLAVSEIGLGGERMEKESDEYVRSVVEHAEGRGVNIMDCWMSDPKIRSQLGDAIRGRRDKWIIQGQIGSTWQNGQYAKSREGGAIRAAYKDLLERFHTDYMDIGMIHFVDETKDFDEVMNGDLYRFVRELLAAGVVRHVGMSTHNPDVARLAVEAHAVDMMLFSVNPAFDLMPPTDDLDLLMDTGKYDPGLRNIHPERERLYRLCEREGVGLTVMKGYGGGYLLSAEKSPFGIALTPLQCLHYALTRPAVASVLVGFSSIAHVDAALEYETAGEDAKDYASALAGAPRHPYMGKCTYCGHCAPCPSRIDVATVNKLYDLATAGGEGDPVPATLKAHYEGLSANAGDCVACGQCEQRCPFGVRVAEQMEKTAAFFATL